MIYINCVVFLLGLLKIYVMISALGGSTQHYDSDEVLKTRKAVCWLLINWPEDKQEC